ncbi:MAG: hypothetical protein OXJ64_04275, partial [Boseongicola sp.]|nr:hypothetical protein [Boseongicola sp.]
MPRAQRKGWLRNALTVNPDMAACHESCCQSAGLEEPGVPNPLVQALGVAHGATGASRLNWLKRAEPKRAFDAGGRRPAADDASGQASLFFSPW